MSGFQHTVSGQAALDSESRASRLERLPRWLATLPMVLHWLWLALRHRSFSLPSCANPAIWGGGLTGEGKLEYLAQMGPVARAGWAATVWLPCGGAQSADEAESLMAANGLSYPVVLKPDVGHAGHGVRRVDGRGGLAQYLAEFPRGERVLIQRWVDAGHEASIYYLHRPDQPRGRIVGLLLRQPPRVIGDGIRSVAQLIGADARLRAIGAERSVAAGDLSRVLPLGEEWPVATVASLRAGGACEDASASITPALSEAIERIARDMGDFHVACFDLKFESIAALRAGRGFTLIEVGGAGVRPEQAWDPRLKLGQAYRLVFERQRELFRIGDAMRRRGHRPVGWVQLMRLHLNRQQLIERYPASN